MNHKTFEDDDGHAGPGNVTSDLGIQSYNRSIIYGIFLI